MARRVGKGKNGKAPEAVAVGELPEPFNEKAWHVHLKDDGSIIRTKAHAVAVGNGVAYLFNFSPGLGVQEGETVNAQEQQTKVVMFPGEWKFIAEEGAYEIITPDQEEGTPDSSALREL